VSLLLAASGPSPYWYLTRGTGVVALLLLTAGVLLGVLTSTRWGTPRWPRFVVSGLHRNVTLLALAFVVVHVITTIVDGYAPIGLRDAVLPFFSSYRPVWLGLGAVAFDLLLALIATSLLRARIGQRVWKLVHWLAYGAWPIALVHAFGTGSDAGSGWFDLLAVGSAATVVLAASGASPARARAREQSASPAGSPPLRFPPRLGCGLRTGLLPRGGLAAQERRPACSRRRAPQRRSRSRMRSPSCPRRRSTHRSAARSRLRRRAGTGPSRSP
jgi:methionine sulfoxide reductase heme-binding subunit